MNIEREVPDLTMPVQDRNLCFGAGTLGMVRWGWAVGAGGRRRQRQSSNIERNRNPPLTLESGKGQEAEVTLSWACTCLKELVL